MNQMKIKIATSNNLLLEEQTYLSDMLLEQKRVDEINKTLKEKLDLADVGQLAIAAAGIFPGVGEVADGVNALIYAMREQYFMALLSIVSMVPLAGDAIGKTGIIAKLISKAGGDKKLVGAAMTKLQGILQQHLPAITKHLAKLQSDPRMGKYVQPMMEELAGFLKNPSPQHLVQAANVEEPDRETIKKAQRAEEHKEDLAKSKKRNQEREITMANKEAKRNIENAAEQMEDETGLPLKEVMNSGPAGPGMGIGSPSTATATQLMTVGSDGGFLMDEDELKQRQATLQPQIVEVLKGGGVTGTGNQVQLLEMIVNSLSSQLDQENEVANNPTYWQRHPINQQNVTEGKKFSSFQKQQKLVESWRRWETE